VLELTRDFLAVFDRDAGRLVDIDTQHAAPGALEIDELVAESHDRGFNQFRQLHSALLDVRAASLPLVLQTTNAGRA
jgi:hypothetical protein